MQKLNIHGTKSTRQEATSQKQGSGLRDSGVHEARWWEAEAGNKVHCYLCPRHCHIGEGQAGFCFIRANEGGKLARERQAILGRQAPSREP